MAVLFLSHSSRDDALASSVEAWLHENGFTDTFVDHTSLAGGSKWRVELRASAGACRVIICLVTENWLASSECFDEFRAAWYMGKRIVPLFLLPPKETLGNEAKTRLAEIFAEDQGIDLAICLKRDRTLDLDADASVARRLKQGLRAAGALAAVGLDPEAFAIDRKSRPTPFPGLAPFGDDDADAAIFHGRSREIAEVLETLRQMRAAAERRPLIILGASGSGKSSLLKAGIIPRLRREARTWLPLRAFRPGADPLLHFAEAIALTMSHFGQSEAQGAIRDRLFNAWSSTRNAAGADALGEALEAEGHRLRAAAGCPEATILISLDQAEELTHLEGASCEALADCLRTALTAPTSWQLAVTIRTDNFPDLQHSRYFQNLEARGYDLRAIPAFRFESVVQEPARRYGVNVDSALIDTLIKDAPGD